MDVSGEPEVSRIGVHEPTVEPPGCAAGSRGEGNSSHEEEVAGGAQPATKRKRQQEERVQSTLKQAWGLQDSPKEAPKKEAKEPKLELLRPTGDWLVSGLLAGGWDGHVMGSGHTRSHIV